MSDTPRDYFVTARTRGAVGLVLGAALMLAGSMLGWITANELPGTIPANQARFTPPFDGFEIGDGYVVSAAAIVVAISAALSLKSAQGSYGWLAFVASTVAGAIAVSNYRNIDAVFEQLGGIGRGVSPGPGLILAAVGALIGLISSVAVVAASPSRS